MDADALAVAAVVALQAIQLAQTAILGRVVRRSLPPPPRQRGTPVFYEDEQREREDIDNMPTRPGRRR